jgi:chromosome partitioning protein
MSIILVGSKKGGVGKSTLATNIAAFLAVHSKDVILVDADIQQTGFNWFFDRNHTGILPKVDCVQHVDNIKDVLIELAQKYEYVIVDCQGRDSLEMRTGLLAADIFIVPCRPSQPDVDTIPIISKMVKKARELNPNLQSYCILTMTPTNPVINEIQEARAYLNNQAEITLLNTVIADRKVYRDAIAKGVGVIEMDNPKAKLEIELLMKEILAW